MIKIFPQTVTKILNDLMDYYIKVYLPELLALILNLDPFSLELLCFIIGLKLCLELFVDALSSSSSIISGKMRCCFASGTLPFVQTPREKNKIF